jgi:hypothetical protein
VDINQPAATNDKTRILPVITFGSIEAYTLQPLSQERQEHPFSPPDLRL